MSRIKSASLDTILAANSKPTTNDLQADAQQAERERIEAQIAMAPHLNSNQRRNLRKTLAKATQEKQHG